MLVQLGRGVLFAPCVAEWGLAMVIQPQAWSVMWPVRRSWSGSVKLWSFFLSVRRARVFTVPPCCIRSLILRQGYDDFLDVLFLHPDGCALPVGDPCPRMAWLAVRRSVVEFLRRAVVARVTVIACQSLDRPGCDEVHGTVGFLLLVWVRRVRFCRLRLVNLASL